MIIELEKEDKTKINEFINKYRDLHGDIEMILKKMGLLEEEKEEILNELIALRQEEESFTNEFTQKYGEGKLDLEKGVYKINETT